MKRTAVINVVGLTRSLIGTHMPRIAEALLFPARSHQIDDVPDAAMTARFGNDESPNACLACHRDKNAAWLQARLLERLIIVTP